MRYGLPALALAIAALGLTVFIVREEETAQTPAAEEPELCEVGKVQQDGSVTLNENQAGNYEYIAFITSSGIKILGACPSE